MAARGRSRAAAMVVARNLLDCIGRWYPAEGAADPDVCPACDRHLGHPRSLGRMALAPSPGLGTDLDAGSCAALVCRNLLARRRDVFYRFDRRRHVEQARGARIPWCAAGILSPAVLGDVLAGSAARRHGGSCGVAGEAGARRAVSAGLAAPVLDRFRIGADEAAALRP